MRFSSTVRIAVVLLVGLALSACSADPSRPATTQQQQAAMHTAAPTAEQLQEAMSKVHIKTPGSGSVPKPPGGAAPQGNAKTGD